MPDLWPSPESKAIVDDDGQTPTFATCACCGCTFGRDDTSPDEIRGASSPVAIGRRGLARRHEEAPGLEPQGSARATPAVHASSSPRLRGAGPAPVPFRFAGTTPFEGLVVRVVGIGGGNGWATSRERSAAKDAVLFAPLRTNQAIVVAGGMGYVVELDTRTLVRSFGGAINELFYLPSREVVIYGNGLWFECEGPDGLVWKTPRLSWDGTEDVRLDGLFLRGRAFDVNDQAWHRFSVNIETGDVDGGAKPPPEVGFLGRHCRATCTPSRLRLRGKRQEKNEKKVKGTSPGARDTAGRALSLPLAIPFHPLLGLIRFCRRCLRHGRFFTGRRSRSRRRRPAIPDDRGGAPSVTAPSETMVPSSFLTGGRLVRRGLNDDHRGGRRRQHDRLRRSVR